MKGSIERRGERVYRIRVDTGRTADGRRVQRSVTVHGTRKEAEVKHYRAYQIVTEGRFILYVGVDEGAVIDRLARDMLDIHEEGEVIERAESGIVSADSVGEALDKVRAERWFPDP